MPLPETVGPIDTRFATKRLFQQILDVLNTLDLDEGALEAIQDGVAALETFETDFPFKIKSAVVAGAGADTNIAIAGIVAADSILSVTRFDVAVDTGTSATGNKVQALDDLTSEAAITSPGNIQLSDTATTGDTLLVLWYDIDAVA